MIAAEMVTAPCYWGSLLATKGAGPWVVVLPPLLLPQLKRWDEPTAAMVPNRCLHAQTGLKRVLPTYFSHAYCPTRLMITPGSPVHAGVDVMPSLMHNGKTQWSLAPFFEKKNCGSNIFHLQFRPDSKKSAHGDKGLRTISHWFLFMQVYYMCVNGTLHFTVVERKP